MFVPNLKMPISNINHIIGTSGNFRIMPFSFIWIITLNDVTIFYISLALYNNLID